MTVALYPRGTKNTQIREPKRNQKKLAIKAAFQEKRPFKQALSFTGSLYNLYALVTVSNIKGEKKLIKNIHKISIPAFFWGGEEGETTSSKATERSQKHNVNFLSFQLHFSNRNSCWYRMLTKSQHYS